jgi:outer membrane protein TolC
MKNILIIILSAVTTCFVWAQDDTLQLTVTKAADIALQNRPDLQSLQKNIAIAENTLQKGKQQILPEIKLNGDVRYNTQLPVTILPEGFAGNAGGNSKVRFGTRNNTAVSLEYNQTLYSPAFQTDLKILKNNIETEKNRLKLQRKEVRYTVMQVYYDALLRQKEWEMNRDDQLLAARLLTVAESRYRLGTLNENDYLKIKLDYNQKEWEEKKAFRNFTTTIELLKKEMNYYEKPLKLTEDFSTGNAEAIPDTSFVHNTEIKLLQLQKQNYIFNFKKAKQEALPTLSLTGNYTTQYQASNFNFNSTWNPFNYIGLKASLPLFSKLNHRAEKKEYMLKQQQADLDITNKKLLLNYEYKKAIGDVTNMRYNFNYAGENYSLASKIYETDLQRYTLGKLLYSELITTENSKLKARKNLIQSMHDLEVAILRLEKAVASE